MNWFTLFTYFCNMKSIFDKVSNDSSKVVIKRYSTSFYFSSNLLSKSIRQDIFNIYGFVRLADEIVDTFHEFPKKELLPGIQMSCQYLNLVWRIGYWRSAARTCFFPTILIPPLIRPILFLCVLIHQLKNLEKGLEKRWIFNS